ncbi:hypothetical protein L0337_16475 [candidate division KSB1 bacterium]|nr:hypothetical protein [candidate division KSB1 bacterium]
MNHNEIAESAKQRILDEILESEDFRQAQKYQELLRYLVRASINGEMLKESTVAVEFFSKDTAFDPAVDSSVRAYISNLRKKLDHYYLTKGRDDEIKLTIPKGHYNVEFIQAKDLKKIRPGLSRKWPALIYGLLVLAGIIFVIYLWRNQLSRGHSFSFISKNDPIWGALFSNNLKTLIVLGDYYFFAMPIDSGRQNYIRDIEINSDDDLEAFIARRPALQKKIAKTYHTYLEEHIPWCLSYLLPSFVRHNKAVELKLASEVQLEDLQKHNIIYLGPYKALQIMKTVTRNLNFKYSPQKGGSLLTYFLQDSNKVYTYSWVTNPETKARNDYVMVVKVFGYSGNVFLFFISEHDFGNISTVRYFTNPEHLREFSDLVALGHFEALFEVKGIIRTDFSMQLLHVNKLHSDFEIDLP